MARISHAGNSAYSALVAALVLCAVLLAPRALAQEQGERAAVPSAGRVDYDVIRDGDKIGTYSVMFWHDGRHLTIATWTDISVTLLGIPFYRFHYEANEEWVNDRLTRLTSRTDNNGTALSASLARDGTRIRGTCNGIALDLPADRLPISMWHPDFVHQSIILDQYKCVERTIRTTDAGTEPVSAGVRTVATRHYAITGQLHRDVWYGPDGQVVQVRFPARDGSQIAFVMRTPSQPPLAPAQNASSPPVQRTR